MTEFNLRLENVHWFNGYNFAFGSITIIDGRIATITATRGRKGSTVCSLTDKVTKAVIPADCALKRSLSKNTRQKKPTIIDCQGKYLIPSFTEAHMHFSTYSKSLGQIDMTSILRLEDLRAAISKIHKNSNEWLVLTNFRANFFEGELPSQAFLDMTSPTTPLIILSFDLHSCLANKRAIELLLSEGIIRKEDIKEGCLYEQSAFNVIKRVNSIKTDTSNEAIGTAIKEINKRGITALQSYDGSHEYSELREESKSELFTARIMTAIRDDDLDNLTKSVEKEFITKWKGTKNSHANNDPQEEFFSRIERGPLKLFSDGALGSQTALMSSAYLSSTENKGIEVMTTDELKTLVKRADKLNLPVSIHAIGDKALDNTLEAFSPLSEERNLYLGNRIEHCQYLRDDHLDKIALSGLSISTLPSHLPYDLRPSLKLLGAKRTKWLHRIDDLERLKIPFALTSDAPVTKPSPIESIYWACDGRKKLYKEENIVDCSPLTRLAALRAVTSTPAAMLYGKDIWGRIAPGLAADLVLLSDNPLETTNILDVKILFTAFNGAMVYRNENW